MHRRALLASAGLLLVPLSARAQQREVSVTIYNSDLALVEDARPLDLKAGRQKLEFKDVFLRYDEDEKDVLRGLNFCTKPQEKVGIVGRTGAGKSSLVAALFRLAEPTGSIKIDGVEALDMGLKDLREKISIIPQVTQGKGGTRKTFPLAGPLGFYWQSPPQPRPVQ